VRSPDWLLVIIPGVIWGASFLFIATIRSERVAGAWLMRRERPAAYGRRRDLQCLN